MYSVPPRMRGPAPPPQYFPFADQHAPPPPPPFGPPPPPFFQGPIPPRYPPFAPPPNFQHIPRQPSFYHLNNRFNRAPNYAGSKNLNHQEKLNLENQNLNNNDDDGYENSHYLSDHPNPNDLSSSQFDQNQSLENDSFDFKSNGEQQDPHFNPDHQFDPNQLPQFDQFNGGPPPFGPNGPFGPPPPPPDGAPGPPPQPPPNTLQTVNYMFQVPRKSCAKNKCRCKKLGVEHTLTGIVQVIFKKDETRSIGDVNIFSKDSLSGQVSYCKFKFKVDFKE